MSRVFVVTEGIFSKLSGKFRSFWPLPWDEAKPIVADQLVDVLNSAAQDGPDRYYVLKDSDR